MSSSRKRGEAAVASKKARGLSDAPVTPQSFPFFSRAVKLSDASLLFEAEVTPSAGVNGRGHSRTLPLGPLPFGIQQVSDLLVVDLHVGHLDGEALLLPLFLLRSLKQGAAQPRNQARLLSRTHHGERLPRAWEQRRAAQSQAPLFFKCRKEGFRL